MMRNRQASAARMMQQTSTTQFEIGIVMDRGLAHCMGGAKVICTNQRAQLTIMMSQKQGVDAR